MIDNKTAVKQYEAFVKSAVKEIAEKPHDAAHIGQRIEAELARCQTISMWNDRMEDLAEHAAEKGWAPERIVLKKYQMITSILLRGADDTWSGRGNDARRAAHEAKLKVLEDIEFELRQEVNAL